MKQIEKIIKKLSRGAPGRSTWELASKILTNLALILFLSSITVFPSHAAPVGKNNDNGQWRYFKGAKTPPQNWNHEDLDDSTWMAGSKGIGYGKRQPSYVLGDMKGRYKRVYARHRFYVQNPQSIRVMGLSVVCDGPFAAYLNGMMVLRNITGLSTPNPVAGGDPIGEEMDISGWAHELNSGLNMLSVHCDNEEIESNDFNFIPSLKIIEDKSPK